MDDSFTISGSHRHRESLGILGRKGQERGNEYREQRFGCFKRRRSTKVGSGAVMLRALAEVTALMPALLPWKIAGPVPSALLQGQSILLWRW